MLGIPGGMLPRPLLALSPQQHALLPANLAETPAGTGIALGPVCHSPGTAHGSCLAMHCKTTGAQTGSGMQCRAAHACRHNGLNRSPQQQDGHTDSDAVLDPWWLLSLLHGKQCDGEPAGADAVEGPPATHDHLLSTGPADY